MESLERRRLLSITVNLGFDENDHLITDGDISLRDAIEVAQPGETIDFAVSLNGATIHLEESLGEIAFEKSLTIDASMLSSGITISAAGADLTPNENNGDGIRIFNITGGSATLVTLKNLTLTGGDVTGNGGAILTSAPLTLIGCSISGNHALHNEGGGIHSTAPLTIFDCILSNNISYGVSSGGGAIWSTGLLTITGSSFVGNRTSGDGGAIEALGESIITDTILKENRAEDSGGAIRAAGKLDIFDSTIEINDAETTGGGIDSSALLTIENSIIRTNNSQGSGGACFFRLAKFWQLAA